MTPPLENLISSFHKPKMIGKLKARKGNVKVYSVKLRRKDTMTFVVCTLHFFQDLFLDFDAIHPCHAKLFWMPRSNIYIYIYSLTCDRIEPHTHTHTVLKWWWQVQIPGGCLWSHSHTASLDKPAEASEPQTLLHSFAPRPSEVIFPTPGHFRRASNDLETEPFTAPAFGFWKLSGEKRRREVNVSWEVITPKLSAELLFGQMCPEKRKKKNHFLHRQCIEV